MRNIPVDTNGLAFVCVSAPRPKLVDQDTGEVKMDRHGAMVYQVGLSVADEATGRAELINVNVSGDPGIGLGEIVRPVGLVGFPWEQTRDGRLRWGIAYRAERIVSAAAAVESGPASPSAAAA
ncbi:hypothetical protein DPM19_10860 [Actinomadura craniellae]|uniref:Regulatory protein n=1 Tax=Actinomadura craniellae TaxID=2231787 RepID=A0A365H810_9ACTN|nr:hypothetical protein [Actinomadura craniellae]RAY15211.1 hypothetical protein DPM19_10860 [Actinomadura craniellae]